MAALFRGTKAVGTWKVVMAASALGACFGLTGVAPEVANIGYLALALVGLGVWIAVKPRLEPSNATVSALLAGVLLFASTLMATGQAGQALPVLYFVPAYAALFYAVALNRPGLSAVGLAAAAGCGGGLLVAIYDAFVLGLPGPGASVNNPIHFGAIMLTLSFVSLVGVYDSRPRVRVVALLGGLAGIAAVWLSEARGPLIALPPMVAVGVFVMLWQALSAKGRLVLTVLSALLAILAVLVVWWGRVLDGLGPFSDIMLLLREGTITDHSTWERVAMYQSAWNAFWTSPLFGHGLTDIALTAARHAPEGVDLPVYDHLHSDLADFAVAGGMMGVLAYLALVFMPLLAANWKDGSPVGRASRFLALTVVTGYLFMGLTNAMFGVLTQTVLFSAVTALLISWSSALPGAGVRGERRGVIDPSVAAGPAASGA